MTPIQRLSVMVTILTIVILILGGNSGVDAALP